MGTKVKEVGGGPATGLANDFVTWLSQGLNTGTFGAGQPAGGDATGATYGMAGILNDILGGGAGQLGGSMRDIMNTESERQAQAIRARFGVGGGTAFGTPGQYAESLFRAEQAPRMTQAIGGLQMQALGQMLPLFAGLASKGIAQRQAVASPSPWASGAAIAAPLIGAGLNMFAPGVGSAAGAAAGSLMPASAPQNLDWSYGNWTPFSVPSMGSPGLFSGQQMGQFGGFR